VEGERFKGRRPTDEGRRATLDQKPKTLGLYFNHHDRVLDLPDDWTVIQRIDDFINIAATKKWLGFQFHPEKDDEHFRHYVLPFLRI
jgi:GMP synthase-like glutamine amidotransferase